MDFSFNFLDQQAAAMAAISPAISLQSSHKVEQDYRQINGSSRSASGTNLLSAQSFMHGTPWTTALNTPLPPSPAPGTPMENVKDERRLSNFDSSSRALDDDMEGLMDGNDFGDEFGDPLEGLRSM